MIIDVPTPSWQGHKYLFRNRQAGSICCRRRRAYVAIHTITQGIAEPCTIDGQYIGAGQGSAYLNIPHLVFA